MSPTRKRAGRSLVSLLSILAAAGSVSASAHAVKQTYATSGSCDGFPKISIQTDVGLCVGLVQEHLGIPRGVTTIGTDIYVVDMGGWRPNHGRVLKLPKLGHEPPQVLLSGLNEPNAIARGPKGSLYVGLSGKIIQFDPSSADPAKTVHDVVTGLPLTGRHPLSTLALADDGSLFINVGSATDHCERSDGSAPDPATACPETLEQPARGSIIHVQPGDHTIDAHGLKPYATGLRNSMAMTVLPSGQLVAAVNARDGINHADPSLSDEELPHDLYDLIEADADYGWPYCFDANRSSPEYPKYDCSHKHLPTLMLPAHAAPLGMVLYQGNALPALAGQLLITYHGYRSSGHRLVALPIDKKGNPVGVPREIVNGWNYSEGGHPQGAPVALAEMDDGSVLITEDHNGTLLRLSHP